MEGLGVVGQVVFVVCALAVWVGMIWGLETRWKKRDARRAARKADRDPHVTAPTADR